MIGSIKVLVVDDHDIVRKGIKALLATEAGIEVLGEAESGEQAIAEVERHQPDVILMDLVMPRVDGIEAIRRIIAHQPKARILVLTNFATDEKVFPAIKAGALGCLVKDSEPQELIGAIHEVHRGESPLHPAIARKILLEISNLPTQPPATSISKVDPLTACEVEILQLAAKRHSNRDIGEQLGISEATVRTHVSNILSKLHLASRTGAALYTLPEELASLGKDEQGV